ncbi:MAG: DUF2332 domain-containing protein, partial [Pseudomonadota bacterium]
LYPGFVTIGRETGLPLELYELGASAGLNLFPDRYCVTLGSREFGPKDAGVRLAPLWSGNELDGPPPVIVGRRGCDLNPLDLTNEEERARMRAYIWPDQPDRLTRIDAAIATALSDPPELDRCDAGDWVDRIFGADPVAGRARVLFHSIAFQYLPTETQTRIAGRLQDAGSHATAATPLAWLAFEFVGGMEPELTLRLWPGGETRCLATADPHVRAIRWIG